MTFKYEYIPEEEKPKFVPVLLAPGTASFKIDDVRWLDKDGSPKLTKAGVPKISFKYEVQDAEGKQGYIYHDISAKMRWAFIQLGQSIGRKVYNESATMDWQSLIGARGYLVIENQNTPGYPTRSCVKSYLPQSESLKVNTVEPAKQDTYWEDEDVPF